jgi:hypothetical protein
MYTIRILTVSLAFLARITPITSANTVSFISRDTIDRTLCFSPALSHEKIPNFSLSGHATHLVTFPPSWEGNWYTVQDGNCNQQKILGEVRFDGFAGQSYYDVSAIVNENDNSGVKWLYPASGGGVHSGCNWFPCDGAYKHSDDEQTRSTPEHDLICEIGG